MENYYKSLLNKTKSELIELIKELHESKNKIVQQHFEQTHKSPEEAEEEFNRSRGY